MSSVAAHENEAFVQESNGESRPRGFQNKATRENSGVNTEKIRHENNPSHGTAKDAENDTKLIQNSSNSQLKNCVQVIACVSDGFVANNVDDHMRLTHF